MKSLLKFVFPGFYLGVAIDCLRKRCVYCVAFHMDGNDCDPPPPPPNCIFPSFCVHKNWCCDQEAAVWPVGCGWPLVEQETFENNRLENDLDVLQQCQAPIHEAAVRSSGARRKIFTVASD